MQKTSRTPVIAVDSVEANVVRLQRRSAAIRDEDTSLAGQAETLSALMERASNAVRQMRYFGLAIKQFSFDELTLSARRAGFVKVDERPRRDEAAFRWAAGTPDLIFSVSFCDPARISIVAESQADVFGLSLTAYSDVSTVSVETESDDRRQQLGAKRPSVSRYASDISGLRRHSGMDEVPGRVHARCSWFDRNVARWRFRRIRIWPGLEVDRVGCTRRLGNFPG